jgi:N utilization substance protein B
MEIAKTTARDAGLDMMAHSDLSDDLSAYADNLVRLYALNKKEIDDRLSKLMREWDYKRIAAVDRNILRMAATELLYQPDLPPAVTINEAVEIAKKYSSAESPRFINGVLGSLLRESDKANWEGPVVREEAEPEPEALVEEVTEAEAEEVKAGFWKVRSDR